MLKTLRIAAFAAGVALAATGGEIVVSPDGMSPGLKALDSKALDNRANKQ